MSSFFLLLDGQVVKGFVVSLPYLSTVHLALPSITVKKGG